VARAAERCGKDLAVWWCAWRKGKQESNKRLSARDARDQKGVANKQETNGTEGTKRREKVCAVYLNVSFTMFSRCFQDRTLDKAEKNRLNGCNDPAEYTTCVFDQPPDTEIWRKVAYWRRQ